MGRLFGLFLCWVPGRGLSRQGTKQARLGTKQSRKDTKLTRMDPAASRQLPHGPPRAICTVRHVVCVCCLYVSVALLAKYNVFQPRKYCGHSYTIIFCPHTRTTSGANSPPNITHLVATHHTEFTQHVAQSRRLSSVRQHEVNRRHRSPLQAPPRAARWIASTFLQSVSQGG